MSLGAYLLKRLITSVPLLLGAVTIIFVLIHTAPGDPTDYIIGDASVDQEFIDRLKREIEFDRQRPAHFNQQIIDTVMVNS